MTDIHHARLAEIDDIIAALRAEAAAKDKEIARLRGCLKQLLTNSSLSEHQMMIVVAALGSGARERSEDEKKERPGAVDTPENTPAGARPGAGDSPAPITKT